MTEKRGAWASNLGFILAAAGSAVGLGNIWKFPGKVGANGGGTFILVYLIMIIFVGTSIMLAEITLGRHTKKNAISAIRNISPRWAWVGKLGMVTSFIILSYYSVVGGWVLKYIATYLTGSDFGESTETFFTSFISETWEPIIWHIIFMGAVLFVVIRGVSAGIEKVSKLLMPMLFIILIAILVRAVTLEGAKEGLVFLTTVRLSDINPSMIIVALGQAFFSLSLGIGVMTTYGSYVSDKDSLPKSVSMIVLLDTFVALIAGFTIVCAVYATDKNLIGAQGGGFAFISLPNVFETIPYGKFFGLLFFVLLLFASITSAISILEGLVASLSEEKEMSRKKSSIILAVVAAMLGCGYSLSNGAMNLQLPWFDVAGGLRMMPLSSVMEMLTDNLLMPLGGLLICIFVAWIWKGKNAATEIRKNGVSKFKVEPIWIFMIKYICPVAIMVILFTVFVLGKGLS